MNRGRILAIALISLFHWVSCSLAIEYTITDLGTLGSDPESKAYAINNLGQVVGYSAPVQGPEAGRRGFLWDNGTMVDLGTLGGDHSEAYGINDLGQVVGRSSTPVGENHGHAFIWQDNSMRDLGTLGGWWSEAYGINNGGLVVGYARTIDNDADAFQWEDNGNGGTMTGGPGDSSRAYGVNESAQVVGFSLRSGIPGHR